MTHTDTVDLTRSVSTTASAVDNSGEPDLDDPGTTTDLVRVYLDEIGRTRLLSAAEEVDLARRIEAGLYAERKIASARAERRRLRAADRRDLQSVAEDGRAALDHMLRANLRLVVSVAKRHTGRGLPFLDLVQEGNVGLVRAVQKFDFRRGFKFSTYAMWWIRQAIQRAIADQSRTIRLPIHVSEEISRLSRAQRNLSQALGRDPTHEELAEQAGISVARVGTLQGLSRVSASLDAPVGEDGDTRFGDLVVDTDGPATADVVEHLVLVRQLAVLVARLSPEQMAVVSLRYGLSDGQPQTLAEIGRRLGMSRDRVRRVEEQALEQLRGDGGPDTQEQPSVTLDPVG